MVNKKGIITAAVAVVIIGGGLTIRHLNADSNKAAAKKVRTINVAHTQNYVPYDYVKNGVSKGYEVDVLLISYCPIISLSIIQHQMKIY